MSVVASRLVRRTLLPSIPYFLLVTFVLFAFVVPSSGAEAQKPAIDLRQHPTDRKTLIDVSVGLFLTNLIAIDETRETFEVSGYLIAKWRDPRLQQSGGGPSRTFKLDELWTPTIESENSISHKANSYDLEADSNGWVTYTEHFDAVLSTALNLRAFPFDKQVLRFEYQPFLSFVPEFRFASEALPENGISPGKYAQLAAWGVSGLRYTTDETNYTRRGGESNRAIFEVSVQRRRGFYVWKVIIPLLIMTLLPTVVFWIDVKDIDWMLKIPMTMLLATVAFEFVVSRDLPKIGYLTLLDAVFLLSMFFYSIGSAEITLVYRLQATGRRPSAERLHAAGRWAYPGAYLIALALLAAYFLR
jgi:hypothetical protein